MHNNLNQQIVFTCSCTEIFLEVLHLHAEVHKGGLSSSENLHTVWKGL